MNVNLVFGIIFAIIVMITVLYFGVGQFTNVANVNSMATFQNKLMSFEDTVDNVMDMSMGSEQKFDFNVPSSIKRVCFVDRNNPEDNPSEGWELTNIKEKLITDYDYNFFYYEDETPKGRKINYLVPEENFCITGRNTLWLENMGRYVGLTK